MLEGHALARHVGRSASALRAELDYEPRLRRLSSFPPGALAEVAVQDALTAHAGRVTSWLKSGSPLDLDVMHRPPLPAGIVVTREATVPGVRVLVVLRRDPDAAAGHRVLTAYPLPERGKVKDAEHLASFFAAGFHQDWLFEEQDFAGRFAACTRPLAVDAVMADVDRLLLKFKEPSALRARLDELDFEYDLSAESLTLRGWLFDLRERLSQQITPTARGFAFGAHLD